ncbi:unnamed protein product [Penicillium manginii]
MSQTNIKAVFFDFMGTCLDWHTSVVKSLPPSIPEVERSKLALEWRRRYFLENSQRHQQELSPEDIDITLARVLDAVLPDFPTSNAAISPDIKGKIIQAWHSQPAWPEVGKAIRSLRDDLGLEVFVHANGVYKPSPLAYQKALDLVKLNPEEVVLVAAHAYDLRGAQSVGLKTVYIQRWTDDIDEDMDKVRTEFDEFLEDMENLPGVISRM